jgi:PilZ domain
MRLVPTLERGLQRRTAVRYMLRLPVIFHWNDGLDHTEGGFTADVGLDGAFILTSRCPSVGSQVRIEVLLPSPGEDGSEVRIECVGQVVRVVNKPGCHGFGVWGVFDDDHLTRQVHM